MKKDNSSEDERKSRKPIATISATGVKTVRSRPDSDSDSTTEKKILAKLAANKTDSDDSDDENRNRNRRNHRGKPQDSSEGSSDDLTNKRRLKRTDDNYSDTGKSSSNRNGKSPPLRRSESAGNKPKSTSKWGDGWRNFRKKRQNKSGF